MVNLKRNETEFEYLPLEDELSDLNEDLEHTGEFHPVYGTPVTYKGSISVPSRNTTWAFYGIETRYTHVILMCDTTADIRENGLVKWKGDTYEITAVRPSLNVLNIAIRRMTNSADEEPDGPHGETGATGETGETGVTGGTGDEQYEPEGDG